MNSKNSMYFFAKVGLFLVVGILSYLGTSLASERVVFSQNELDAAFTLVRPELNQLELVDQKFVLNPAPALKFFGIERTEKEINMTEIADILGLRFNSIRNRQFQIRFNDQGLELRIPLEDQQKALQSKLGSISIKGVTIVGLAGLKQDSNTGRTQLYLKDVNIVGSLSGSGVLKPKWILKNVIKVIEKVVRSQLNGLLNKPKTQDAIQAGLLGWGKFYTGSETQVILPGAVMNENGIQFEVN